MNRGTILILVVLVSSFALFTSGATAQTGTQTEIYPESAEDAVDQTGIPEIEVGETMVIEGTTTSSPDETTIVVEPVEGPSIDELSTSTVDYWGQNGRWRTTIYIPSSVEPGEYDIHVDSGNRRSIHSVDIIEERRELTIENEPDSYTPGSEVSISGTAEGVDSIDVYVRDDEDYHYITSIPTSGRGSYQSSLSLSEVADTSEARELLTTPGVYRLAVVDNDDSDTRTLTSSELHTSVTDQVALRVVEPADPANLQITDYEFRSSEVQAGETVRADATVRNVGDETASANVQYFLDLDIGRRSMEGISLQSGETESLQFTLTVPNNVDEGSYEQRISTEDDSVSSRITVETEDPAYFEITDFELQNEAIVGEQVQAEATIQNTGDRRDSRTVRFYVDGNSEGMTSVSLSGGLTEIVDFSYTPDSVGDYEQEFRTGDDTIRRTITVREDDVEAEMGDIERTPMGSDGVPNWEDRTFLPGGASVPIGDLNNPMTLTILGLILSIAGILIQMTSRF